MAAQASVQSASPDQLKAIARQWFDLVNSGDVDRFDDIMAWDVVDHSQLNTGHGGGCDGHKSLVRELRRAFPGWKSEIVDLQVQGDKVTIRHRGTGIQPAGLKAIVGAGANDPALQQASFEIVSTVRIQDGKIVEHWANQGPFGTKGGPGWPDEGGTWTPGPATGGTGTGGTGGTGGAGGPVYPGEPQYPGGPSGGTGGGTGGWPEPSYPGGEPQYPGGGGQGGPSYPSGGGWPTGGGGIPGGGEDDGSGDSWPIPPSPGPQTPQKNFMQRYVHYVIDGEAPDRARYYFPTNFYNHDRAPGERTGLEGVTAFLQSIYAAFSGFRTTIEEQLGENDFVVGRWKQRFRNTGPYLGFPPSGKEVHVAGITITRVRDGRILEEWEARDAVSLVKQMGVPIPIGPLEGGDEASGGQPGVQSNKDVVLRYFYEAWSGGRLETVDQVFAPGFVNNAREEGQKEGRDGIRQWIRAWRGAFPDFSVSVDLLLGEGDRVAARWTARGTQRGPLMGVKPSGKEMEITGITVFRVSGGQIQELWGFWELFSLLLQAGAVQLPGGWDQPGGGQPGGQPGGQTGGGQTGGGGWGGQPGGQTGGQQPGGQTGGGWGGQPGGQTGGQQPGGQTGGQTGGQQNEEELKAVVRQWFDLLNSGQEDRFDEIMEWDVVDHSQLNTGHGGGCDGHKALVRQLRHAFPEWRSEIVDLQVQGDTVIVHHRGRGIQPAALKGILGAASSDPALQKATFDIVSTVRIQNGKIVEHWANQGPFGRKAPAGGWQA